jgi:hypothetical protein
VESPGGAWPGQVSLTLILRKQFRLFLHRRFAWSAAQAPRLHPATDVRPEIEADQAMTNSVAKAARIARRLAVALPVLAALSACAPGSSPETAQTSARAEMQQSPVCRPDSALLAPPTAPDCAFGRHELKTLDPDRWARLKIEYERRCYQQAEKGVRERLRLLQAASRC